MLAPRPKAAVSTNAEIWARTGDPRYHSCGHRERRSWRAGCSRPTPKWTGYRSSFSHDATPRGARSVRGQRDRRTHDGPAAGQAVDRERAVERRHAVTQAEQAATFGLRPAHTVVAD